MTNPGDGNPSQPAACSQTLPANSTTTLTIPSLSFSDIITDVTPFIPIVLDLHSRNYYHWRHLFEIHLGRCSLLHHISDASPPEPHNPRWLKDDLAIIQWLYTRISTELFNLVVKDGATARDIWTELRRLFQDNRDARISALNVELRTITQGDRPVGVFCQQIKAIGDELRELGETVADRSLLHALMGGLDERFAQQASLIPLLRPLPPLSEARSMLQLEEQTQARKTGAPRLSTPALALLHHRRPPRRRHPQHSRLPDGAPAPTTRVRTQFTVHQSKVHRLPRRPMRLHLRVPRRHRHRPRRLHHQLLRHGVLLLTHGLGLFKPGPCHGLRLPHTALRLRTVGLGRLACARLSAPPVFSAHGRRHTPTQLMRRCTSLLRLPRHHPCTPTALLRSLPGTWVVPRRSHLHQLTRRLPLLHHQHHLPGIKLLSLRL